VRTLFNKSPEAILRQASGLPDSGWVLLLSGVRPWRLDAAGGRHYFPDDDAEHLLPGVRCGSVSTWRMRSSGAGHRDSRPAPAKPASDLVIRTVAAGQGQLVGHPACCLDSLPL
jgi:hypothetical protein